MEVSHLQVKVTSDGVDKVSRQLGGLGNSANNAEVKVNKLTDSITKLIGLQGRLGTAQQSATSLAQNQVAAFANLNTAMGQVAAAMHGIVAATTALASGLANVHAQSNNTAGAFERKAKWGNVVSSTLKAMATAGAAYMALNLVKNIVESADKWQMMSAKLTVVTHSQQNATRAMEDIYETAQRLRVPLESVTQLWTRMAAPMQRMGRSGDDVTRVVKSVSTALQLSGATAAEASSAMLQLSQSFNAGRLNGAEFNSIAEAAPLILEAIAAKSGRTREELKKMGADGQITGQLMVDALMAVGNDWDKLFDKLPITFGGAMTVLKNRWFKEIGEMGKDTGFNQELIKAVRTVESIIPGIARGLAVAFVELMKWIEANKTKLGEIWDQVLGLASDIWEIGKGFAGWIGKIAGAGEEVSVVAAGIFGVRLAIAAIVDITKGLAAVLLYVGSIIWDVIIKGLGFMFGLITKVVDVMSSAVSLGAKFADFIGDKKGAAQFRELSAGMADWSTAAKENYKTMDEAGGKARKVADELLAGWKSGQTEVQKVLDSSKKLQESATKGKTPWDTANWGKATGGAPDDKAIKAAAKETEKYEKAIAALNNKLEEQATLADRLSKYGLDYDKLSAGTKERIKLANELQKLEEQGGSEEAKRRMTNRLMMAAELELWEQENERKIEGLRVEKAAQTTAENKLKTLEEEAKKLEYKRDTYGMLKGAMEELEATEIRTEIRRLERMPMLNAHEEKMLELLRLQLEFRERISAASGAIGQMEGADALDKLLDSTKVVKFGNDFKEAFGKAGKAVGAVADAFEKMNQRQTKTNKMREDYSKLTVKDARSEAQLARIREQEGKDALDTYADMAGAAKNFFDEKSKGYKALEAAEKVFRAFEMAMELKSFMMKIGNTLALTSAKVAGDAAITTSATTAAGAQIAADQATSASGAVAGVIGQAKGDPYTAFARMAAMAAIMAALGYATGSFGGGDEGGAPPTNTGTGTVFGDPTAQSESLANSIDLLSDIDRMTMRYSAQMASSLESIAANIGGLTNLVLRNTSGVSAGGGFGIEEGKISNGSNPLDALGIAKPLDDFISNSGIVGHIHGALIKAWGSVSKEITSAGLWIGGSLRQLQAGLGMAQYADVKTTERSYFGMKKETSYDTLFQGLDPELARQFGLVLSNMADAVSAAAMNLGASEGQISAALDGLVLNIGRIDLKGLNGQQIKERLEAVFGSVGDTMAKAVIPGFEDFQRAGEGYLETIVRTSSGVEQATLELEKFGIAAIGVNSILNKQGDVGAEIVRQSIMLAEGGSNIGDIIGTLAGTASDIAEAYSALTQMRRELQAVGFKDLTLDIIRAAGGLEALSDAVASYTSNFFSDAEQQAMRVAQLTEDFQKLGLAMPASRAAFRSLVEMLQANGNNSLATQVLLLADSFSELDDATAIAAEAVNEARNALSEVYERERDALESVREKFQAFSDSLREFKESLLVGELSTLTNPEKYNQLRSQYQTTASAAMAGDEDAIANFQAIASEFLSFSREYNASGEAYTADFNAVLAMTQALEEMTGGRATEAETQLTLLEEQIGTLLDINESVLTVTQAIANLQAALTGQSNVLDAANGPMLDPNHVADHGTGSTGGRSYALGVTEGRGDDPLLAEVRALRSEITTLREQQANETAAIIGSTYDSNEQNAQMVVAGQAEAANTTDYSERVRGRIG